MQQEERLNPIDISDAVLNKYSTHREDAHATGKYQLVCRDANGKIKWQDHIDNLVTTVGKNLALDTIFAGSAYSVVGPFLGLISSVSFGTVAVGDTMGSHAGWLEAGGTNAPTYTGNRPTAVFASAAAGSKSLTTGLIFSFTGAGTIKGCFVVLGTGAVTTKDNTSGVLYSAGLFSGGDKTVANTDTLTVTYTAGM